MRIPYRTRHILAVKANSTWAICPLYSDHHAIRDNAAFGDDDDAVSDVVMRVVDFVGLADRGNDHVVADPGVLIDNSVFDPAIGANSDARLAGFFMLINRLAGLVVVASQQDRPVQYRAGANNAAQADDTMAYGGPVDNAPIRNDRMIDLGPVDF